VRPSPRRHRTAAAGVDEATFIAADKVEDGIADVGGDRLHEEGPRQQAEAGGDDGGVDQPSPVPPRDPPPDQDQQACCQDGVTGKVEPVRDRREGALVQDEVDNLVQHVPDDEQQLADGKAPPQQRPGWPVTARRDQDGRDRREADQVIGEVAPRPSKGSRR
jgi:hypothetical protein